MNKEVFLQNHKYHPLSEALSEPVLKRCAIPSLLCHYSNLYSFASRSFFHLKAVFS